MLTKQEVQSVFEALVSAYEELTELEQTYDSYVTTGPLMEQLEQAMRLLEEHL